MLRRNKLNARIQESLLGGEYVECRALPDLGLFPHAGERGFRRGDLRLRRPDYTRGIHVDAPGGDDRGADCVALQIGLQFLLAELFFGLARRGIGGAAVVDRNAYLAHQRGGKFAVRHRKAAQIEPLGDLADQAYGWIKRPLDHLDVKLGGVHPMEGANNGGMFDLWDGDRLGGGLGRWLVLWFSRGGLPLPPSHLPPHTALRT